MQVYRFYVGGRVSALTVIQGVNLSDIATFKNE